MKALLALLISSSLAAAAEPLFLKLDYKEGVDNNYAAQIQTAFTKLLATDSTLSKQYAKFEAPPSENARGRYSGEPTVLPIQISEESHAITHSDGVTKAEFREVIAFYYRFDDGMHRGSETRSGFFALFTVVGELSLGDGNEVLKSNVVATFQGFSRNLVAPKPNENDQGQPATRSESKSEGGDKPQPKSEGRSR